MIKQEDKKRLNKILTAGRSKCSYADKYKALRPPRCGCRACEYKWIYNEWKRKHAETSPTRD